MSESFDVVVVGSGAGGGVVAGELAERGRNVLLLEVGPHKTAADFTRWEAKAAHDLWWPIRFALIDGGAGGAVGLIGGRCVGGSTTINTKVALRAPPRLAKWHEASGLGVDLDPHYDRVESGSGSASGPTGRRASAPSSQASARSARSSSPCARTPTRTA